MGTFVSVNLSTVLSVARGAHVLCVVLSVNVGAFGDLHYLFGKVLILYILRILCGAEVFLVVWLDMRGASVNIQWFSGGRWYWPLIGLDRFRLFGCLLSDLILVMGVLCD